jgi:hypothetical protein
MSHCFHKLISLDFFDKDFHKKILKTYRTIFLLIYIPLSYRSFLQYFRIYILHFPTRFFKD